VYKYLSVDAQGAYLLIGLHRRDSSISIQYTPTVTMSHQHTYLRYECADTMGLVVHTSHSHSVLAAHDSNRVWTTAGSTCALWNIKTSVLEDRLAHVEQTSVGTGQALNSDEVICLDQAGSFLATGWADGGVRVFDVKETRTLYKARSLLQQQQQQQFTQKDGWQDPLTLQGHSSPVRTVVLENVDGTVSRLASGSADGVVILWDLVAERGMFRLLGHKNAITEIHFGGIPQMDVLLTASLDGLVKVWDLQGQYCVQTIANHPGEVWSTCLHTNARNDRKRLLTGGNDGVVRVWKVTATKRVSDTQEESEVSPEGESSSEANMDDVCHFMGSLTVPPNIAMSTEKVACVRYHGSYVGILHANDRNIDIYVQRSQEDTLRKKQRRLKRKAEKQKKSEKEVMDGDNKDGSGGGDNNGKNKKRGLLDDPVEDVTLKQEQQEGEGGKVASAMTALPDDMVKASDEYEYVATVRASHKLKSFVFAPVGKKGEILRVVCTLSTNSVEAYSVSRERV
jgi:WD40 repeat protein